MHVPFSPRRARRIRGGRSLGSVRARRRRCDVNASGVIDTSDALGTLRYAVGLYHESVCKRPVRVVLRLSAPVESSGPRRVGSVQIAIDYADLPGHFLGYGDQVRCTNTADALAVFNHNGIGRSFAAGWISIPGIEAPADIASCIFERYGPRDSLAFDVSVVDATDTDLAEMPGVVVTAEER